MVVIWTAISVVLGAVAWWMYPVVQNVDRPAAMTAIVSSTRVLDAVELVSTAGPQGTTVTVRLYASESPSETTDAAPTVKIRVPGSPMEQTRCEKPTICVASNTFDSSNAIEVVTVEALAALDWEPESSGGDSATMTIHMDGKSLGLDCNESACRGMAPKLLIEPGTPLTEGAYGRSFMVYPNMTDYRWNAEGISSSGVTNTVSITSELALTTSVLGQISKPVDGDNPTAAQSAGIRGFIAGALVGIAGGALIGAVESTAAWLRARRRSS